MNEVKSQSDSVSEALAAAPENLQYKPQKNYSLPFIWAYFAPVFSVTAAGLVKLQAITQIPWMSFIVLCGVGIRVMILPMMIQQMTLINKMSGASPNVRLAVKLFKHSNLALHKRLYYLIKAVFDFQKQTKTSLTKFYLYNIIQLPIFITMVLSIRKVCYESSDMTNAGIWWFPNLSEPDPYFILPITAAVLNYFNLSVSCPDSLILSTLARNYQGE